MYAIQSQQRVAAVSRHCEQTVASTLCFSVVLVSNGVYIYTYTYTCTYSAVDETWHRQISAGYYCISQHLSFSEVFFGFR